MRELHAGGNHRRRTTEVATIIMPSWASVKPPKRRSLSDQKCHASKQIVRTGLVINYLKIQKAKIQTVEKGK